MSPYVLAILIPAFAFADRAWGSLKGGRKLAIGVALAAAGLGWFAAGPTVAVLALAWAPYRSLGFAVGAMAPTTDKQRLKALIHHLPVIPAAIPAAVWGAQAILPAVLVMAAYAVGATALAFWYGQELRDAIDASRPIGNQNATVESVRGALYGAALLFVGLIR